MSKRFDTVTDVNPASFRKARAKHESAQRSTPDTDYTIPGIIALFGIVLLTALFLKDGGTIAQQASDASVIQQSLAGKAYGGELSASGDATSCEVQSYCDGSKLIRQHNDCTHFVSWCDYGCKVRSDGLAVCR